jgi:regulatory protein
VPSRRTIQLSLRATDRIEQEALRYLARKDRTEAQVRAYLARRGASTALTRKLIREFIRNGYVNDSGYAQRWALARLEKRPMGRERLQAELLAQGFGGALVTDTVERLYRGRSERELAQRLLAGRRDVRMPRDLARAAGLLRRHGFNDETIEAIVREDRSS